MLTHARTAAAALGCVSFVTAQGYAWGQAATAGPSPREVHAMAFDPLRNRTVLFGGNSGSMLGDTWEWDGASWVPQLLANSPGPRQAHAMVFDPQRGRVVVFGGNNGGPNFTDTWAWDGTAWAQVHTGGPPRREHAMVYDTARSRIVVFGGGGGGGPFGDTWEWDGAAWTQRATTGPSPRNMAAMAFDSVRGRTVLFGGYGPGGVFGDTWEWDGTTWNQRSASGPGPRHSPRMVFFRQRARCVLYGGWGTTTALSDTWEWNGGTWTQVLAVGPGPRVFHAMTYDSTRRNVVLWGGADGLILPADTWELGFPIATAFGGGCGSPPLTLAPVAASPPLTGTTALATVGNVPSPLTFVSLGVSKEWFGAFALPVTLAGIGMPGCFLHQSADVVGQSTAPFTPGTALFGFAIPNNAALVGFHVYLQAWAWAPAANAANVIVSNGLDWQVGT
jgi:hypothetical protein